MNITTPDPIRIMTPEFYIKQPKSMLEVSLRRKLDENPSFIKTLDRRSFHPLIRKYSYIPFKDFNPKTVSYLSRLIVYFSLTALSSSIA